MDPESPFRRHLEQVNRLISNDGSLSGHERNCLFLNVGQTQFATASAVTGFDFEDDTRAVATVDWDGDGDLDVWTTNRTSPRVRVLRNDQAGNNHFLSIKLQGTKCNRDAIGARVEVMLDSHTPGGPRLVRTLRAGEGFLTQQNKRLHFGLGQGVRVQEIFVDWPGGTRESFRGMDLDHQYLLIQGHGKPRVMNKRPPVSLAAESLSHPALSGQARIPLTARIRAPRLPYEDFSGQLKKIGPGPTYVMLWSSQCGSCLEELRAFADQQHRFAREKLSVVALSVDPLIENSPPASAAKRFLASIRFDSIGGVATPELIKRLEMLYDMPFASPTAMATPTGFLLDEQQRLAAIYRGSVEPDQLIDDVRACRETDSGWLAYALPHAGRWSSPPTQKLTLLQIPRQLVERGYLDDAIDYVDTNRVALSKEDEFAKLAVWIADQLIAKQLTTKAMTYYQWALETQPADVEVMNNVAWQLATHPDASIRDGEQAIQWAERAAQLTGHRNAGILDTLAAAYAELGEFDRAVATATTAIKLGDPALAERISKRRATYQQGRPHRQ